VIHRRQIHVEFNRCDLAGIAFSPRRFEMTNSVVENFCHEAMDDRFARLLAEGVDKPTAYRARLRAIEAEADLSSRRAAVSAGETLPAPVYEAWIARTGKPPCSPASAPPRCGTASSPTAPTTTPPTRRGAPSRATRRGSWTTRCAPCRAGPDRPPRHAHDLRDRVKRVIASLRMSPPHRLRGGVAQDRDRQDRDRQDPAVPPVHCPMTAPMTAP
jgi:hypothetical protein